MIEINKNYALKTDDKCLMLCEKHIAKEGKKKGRITWDIIGYFNHGRFDHVFERMVEMGIKDIKTLKEMSDLCLEMKKHISICCEKLIEKPIAPREDHESEKYIGAFVPGKRIAPMTPVPEDIDPKKWHKIATEVKRRDKFLCQRCKDKSIPVGYEGERNKYMIFLKDRDEQKHRAQP